MFSNRTQHGIILSLVIFICKYWTVAGASDTTSNLKACQTEILVSVFATVGFCLVVTLVLLAVCSVVKRRGKGRHEKRGKCDLGTPLKQVFFSFGRMIIQKFEFDRIKDHSVKKSQKDFHLIRQEEAGRNLFISSYS